MRSTRLDLDTFAPIENCSRFVLLNFLTVSRETFASNNPTATTIIRTFDEILCTICTSRDASAMWILKKSPFRLAFSFS